MIRPPLLVRRRQPHRHRRQLPTDRDLVVEPRDALRAVRPGRPPSRRAHQHPHHPLHLRRQGLFPQVLHVRRARERVELRGVEDAPVRRGEAQELALPAQHQPTAPQRRRAAEAESVVHPPPVAVHGRQQGRARHVVRPAARDAHRAVVEPRQRVPQRRVQRVPGVERPRGQLPGRPLVVGGLRPAGERHPVVVERLRRGPGPGAPPAVALAETRQRANQGHVRALRHEVRHQVDQVRRRRAVFVRQEDRAALPRLPNEAGGVPEQARGRPSAVTVVYPLVPVTATPRAPRAAAEGGPLEVPRPPRRGPVPRAAAAAESARRCLCARRRRRQGRARARGRRRGRGVERVLPLAPPAARRPSEAVGHVAATAVVRDARGRGKGGAGGSGLSRTHVATASAPPRLPFPPLPASPRSARPSRPLQPTRTRKVKG